MRRSILAAAALLLTVLATPAFAVNPERVISHGGVEAWLVQDHSNPIIDMEVAFKGGAAVEAPARPGLATMVAGLLDEGSGPYDSEAFQAKLEDLAVELNFEAGKDTFRGHLKTLSDKSDTAFGLFRLALTQPRFDKEPVERIRGQILASLARQQQSPDHVAGTEWFKQQFAGHPYALPTQGTPDSIKAITADDLRGYVRSHLGRDVLVVAVVGDITPAQLKPLLDTTFGALPAKARAVEVSEIAPKSPGSLVVVPRDNPQSVAMFGAPGLKRADPDWYAAYVMNYILGGGGFSSWLTEEVREKRGLAYSVYCYLQPMVHAGLIVGGVATENAHVADSIRLIKEQFARMRDQGPTDQDLADAKTYLTGSFPLQLDSTTSIASLLVTIQLDHLGIDYLDRRSALIGAVTQDDIKRVAQRLLDPAALSFVVVGKPDGVTAKP